MTRLLFSLSIIALLSACTRGEEQAPPPVVLGSNISGAIVAYSGDHLRDADMEARHVCEKYNRGAALVNDINGPKGNFAYYYCQ